MPTRPGDYEPRRRRNSLLLKGILIMSQSYYKLLQAEHNKSMEQKQKYFKEQLPQLILWADRLKNWQPYKCEHCSPILKIIPHRTIYRASLSIVLKPDAKFVKSAQIILDEFYHSFPNDIDPESVKVTEYSYCIEFYADCWGIEIKRNETCTPITITQSYEKTIGYTC